MGDCHAIQTRIMDMPITLNPDGRDVGMREPDLYLELDESVINEAMAAGWQTGLATAKGTIDLAGNLPETIPEALKTMARADWRVTLNGEPLLDFRPPDRLFLRCDAELELMIPLCVRMVVGAP